MSLILLPIFITIVFIILLYKLISFLINKKEKKMKVSTKLLITMLISLVIVITGTCVIANTNIAAKAPTSPKISNGITYSILNIKPLGNIGETTIILINPEDKIEENIIRLGKQLSIEYKNKKIAYVYIYDSEDAASLFDKVIKDEELTESENLIYNNHFIGRYFKNSNTEKNEFLYYLNGLNEDAKIINY